MMKLNTARLVAAFVVALLPLGAQADQQISLGLGKPYGGLIGAKYSYRWDRLKVFGGVGFLGKAHKSSAQAGYNLGFEYLVLGSKHSLGASYGAQVHSNVLDVLYGGAVHYTYYFSGFEQRSWLLGVSVYSVENDRQYRHFRYKETEEGFHLIAGFQF